MHAQPLLYCILQRWSSLFNLLNLLISSRNATVHYTILVYTVVTAPKALKKTSWKAFYVIWKKRLVVFLDVTDNGGTCKNSNRAYRLHEWRWWGRESCKTSSTKSYSLLESRQSSKMSSLIGARQIITLFDGFPECFFFWRIESFL